MLGAVHILVHPVQLRFTAGSYGYDQSTPGVKDVTGLYIVEGNYLLTV